MAELRLRFGKGANDIAHKICHRHLLETQYKQGKCATHASSLPAGVLAVDIQNGSLSGAENAAEVTVGVPRDGYTRVNAPLCAGNNAWGNGFVAEYDHYIGLKKEYSLSKEIRVQIRGRLFSRHRCQAEFRRTFCTSRIPRRYLWWRHGQVVFIRAYTGNGDRSVPLYKTKTGYYEILEVSPTATHAQIKTAYYKQSFIYHPDRNSGSDEATVRFSDINEAYTVLGNKGLRKRYDRGLLSLSDLTATAKPSAKDTAGSPAKQQAGSRRSAVTADSREGVFDFDQFFKSHYNEQLQRQRDIRIRKEDMMRKKQETMGEKKLGRMMEVGVGVLLAMAVGILISLKRG
ncbi:uncharacterized protein LOC122997838 [Thunnus albacares]|uniref:uncharacterized protein LOC122997838 n=1 Tax=Thunnus albacares TaxID=8236 RepID=UPI001CF69D8F|nr:uncharacterized protein LOC122997838 [Thunnus albacares]